MDEDDSWKRLCVSLRNGVVGEYAGRASAIKFSLII
jgi:hypothetical protein